MILDQNAFDVFSAIQNWFLVTATLLFGALLVGLLAASLNRRSFNDGLAVWARHLREVGPDILGGSFRRIWSLTRHSIKESIHRRVLLVFVVFAVLFLFAGWYLESGSREQVRYYVTFVLKATSWLTLLVALLLSCFSLPTDIRARTIHTVVTKPVRRSEIILGRILGFTLMGTAILVVMGGVSLAFVQRGVGHTHGQIDPNRLVFFEGNTQSAQTHQHKVTLSAGGDGRTDEIAGHFHEVREFRLQPAAAAPQVPEHTHELDIAALSIPDSQGSTPVSSIDPHTHTVSLDPSSIRRLQQAWAKGDRDVAVSMLEGKVEGVDVRDGVTDQQQGHYHLVSDYAVGAAEDQLVARRPIYGRLRFRGRQGEDMGIKGLSVGHLWEYRQYIEGGSQMAGLWGFHNLRQGDNLGDSIRLEMTLEVYRSFKGNEKDRVLAEMVLINPKNPKRRSRPFVTGIREYHFTTVEIPRQLEDTDGETLDLYNDLIAWEGCGARLSDGSAKPTADKTAASCPQCGGRVTPDQPVCDYQLLVEVSCASPQQYLGMAQGDLYLRAGDSDFMTNFVKSLMGVWLQMTLVICVGVVTSAFLSGPVAGLATLGIILAGSAMPFMREVASGELPGALQSIIRLVSGHSEQQYLEPTPWVQAALLIDEGLKHLVGVMTYCTPDLGSFDTARFVANGFDVPLWPDPEQRIRGLAMHFLVTFGYVLPYSLLGYMSLKVREIAR